MSHTSPYESTPPVARILITSTCSLTCCRTTSRKPYGPYEIAPPRTLGSSSTHPGTSLESPWPPVIVSACPAASMRGPDDRAVVDRVADREIDAGAAADVADRREPVAQHRLRVAHAVDRRLRHVIGRAVLRQHSTM